MAEHDDGGRFESTQAESTQKFVSPESPPEGLERELLTVLMEECAEVTQRASKALRFGLAEVQPGQPDSNAERIADELGDLIGVVDRLEMLEVLAPARIDSARRRKRLKLYKYLQSDT
jgi:NTP pyrophosphatase (non-canonical NTP hydrolase)